MFVLLKGDVMNIKRDATFLVLLLINTVSICLLPPEPEEMPNPSPLIPIGSVLAADNTYKTPAKNLKYNEVCFLAAHNAHSSSAYGYLFYQQNKNITDLLKLGVRGLLLDTYPVKKSDLTTQAKPAEGESVDGYEVMLWHTVLGHDLKKTYKDALSNEILSFLKANPTEIVTVVLEDYSTVPLNDAIVDRAGIGNYVLKPSDWDPIKKNGWPTLQWMIENNKRLIIFTSEAKLNNAETTSKYMYPQWKCMVENQYSTLDVDKAAVEREESLNKKAKKYLLSINYFGEFSSKLDPRYLFKINNTEGITNLINKIYENGLAGKYKNRYPNIINLDFAEEGYGLAICNFINKISGAKADRASTIFRPLE